MNTLSHGEVSNHPERAACHPEPVEGRLSLAKPIAFLLAAALLAACGGGGASSTTPPIKTGGSTGQMTKVQLTITFPGKGSSVASRSASHAAATKGVVAGRTRMAASGYSSYSTKSIGASVVAHGAGLPALNAPQYTANVTPGYSDNNTTCTAVNPDGSYSCEVLVPAAVGYDDFQLTEWDATGATGNLLAIDTQTNFLTEQNQVNTLTFNPNGVVYGAQTSLTTTTMVSGTSNTTTVSVNATDADGNLITGTQPYVDASNVPVTLQVAGTVNPALASGDFSGLSFNNYTAPGVTNTITYTPTSGLAITNVAFALTATTGTVTATNLHGEALPFTQSNNGVSVPAVPQASALTPALTNPGNDIITASDGNLYVGEGNEMAQVVPGSGLVTQFAITGTEAQMTPGLDNDIWYIDSTSSRIAKFAPSVTPVITETPAFLFVTPKGITTGADGNIYVTVQGLANGISSVIPQTTAFGAFESDGAGKPYGIAAGPTVGGDSTVWFTDQNINGTNGSGTGYLDLKTQILTRNIGTVFAGTAYRLVLGRDGLIYVTQTGPNAIVSINPQAGGAIVHTYPLSASPQWITVGPDGNIWVAENPGYLARLTIEGGTTPGVLTEFGSTSSLAVHNYVGIAAGSDGNIYFTDDTNNDVGKLTLP